MFGLVPWGRKSERDRGGTALEKFKQPLGQMEKDFDRLFDRLTDDWFGGLTNEFFGGRQRWGFDVDNRADEVVVRAEVPGFEPDEIDVQLSGNCLCISAEHRKEENGENGSHHEYGSFRRMVTVPEGIEAVARTAAHDRAQARPPAPTAPSQPSSTWDVYGATGRVPPPLASHHGQQLQRRRRPRESGAGVHRHDPARRWLGIF